MISAPSLETVTDDDDSMSSIIRQRRLPLIGTLPPSVLRSPNDYTNPYHTVRSEPGVSGGTIYYTPTNDIPSPSPSSAQNFPIYEQGVFHSLAYNIKLLKLMNFLEWEIFTFKIRIFETF